MAATPPVAVVAVRNSEPTELEPDEPPTEHAEGAAEVRRGGGDDRGEIVSAPGGKPGGPSVAANRRRMLHGSSTTMAPTMTPISTAMPAPATRSRARLGRRRTSAATSNVRDHATGVQKAISHRGSKNPGNVVRRSSSARSRFPPMRRDHRVTMISRTPTMARAMSVGRRARGSSWAEANSRSPAGVVAPRSPLVPTSAWPRIVGQAGAPIREAPPGSTTTLVSDTCRAPSTTSAMPTSARRWSGSTSSAPRPSGS